jgi:hypothetical protein
LGLDLVGADRVEILGQQFVIPPTRKDIVEHVGDLFVIERIVARHDSVISCFLALDVDPAFQTNKVQRQVLGMFHPSLRSLMSSDSAPV